MGNVKRLVLCLLFTGAALAFGADWLSPRGDTQNSGWQSDEKVLNTRTVGRLHLLWHRKLSDFPDSVTDPLILGPIVTHRGIKELVFVANTAGLVYAIDADLGRIFWTRSLGSPSACSESRAVQPTMKPSPPSSVAANSSDNFSDGNRPLYTLTAKGTVFPLRPSTGEDFSPPFQLLPSAVFALRIQALESGLRATTSTTCQGIANASWIVPVSAGGVPAGRTARVPSGSTDLLAQFSWHERLWQATADRNGHPQLRPVDAAQANMLQTSAGLATWQDADATRWIYTAVRGQLAAFQLQKGKGARPVLMMKWRLSNVDDPGAPVVANGIVYCLSTMAGGRPLVLRAVNAFTGEELYTSKNLVPSRASSRNLAVANGHVCFSAADGRTYCFGLPLEG